MNCECDPLYVFYNPASTLIYRNAWGLKRLHIFGAHLCELHFQTTVRDQMKTVLRTSSRCGVEQP